jgi:sporulation integral membrane protein YlbJ
MEGYLLITITGCILYLLFKLLKKVSKKYKEYFYSYIIILIVLWIVINIVIYPENAVNAANNGLMTWFNIVLPSLLPFFIVSEILIGLGVVNFIGNLLKPIMMPLFGVPGEGAFPFAMSITSGYPVGAKIVSRLRIEKKLTQIEAQRLMSFCSTSGPLFMIGAVSVGMFKNSAVGPLIALAHYLGVVTVGMLFKFYKPQYGLYKKEEKKINIKNAFKSLAIGNKGYRNLGKLMGDSVKESFNTILIVGGFIILYSVVIEILSISNVIAYISNVFTFVLPTGNTPIFKGLLSGIIEITNGCQIISTIENTSMITKLMMVSFIIGWSGLSIHSQVASIVNKTDINMKIYILAKLFHGLLASLYTYILYIFMFRRYIALYAFNNYNLIEPSITKLSIFQFSLKIQIVTILIIIMIGLLISLLNSIKCILLK